uniref:Uncharacterized protein n=1 Tax=Oryza nivara TaxID=4536 RepID=A0A0E0JCN0_ORYNI
MTRRPTPSTASSLIPLAGSTATAHTSAAARNPTATYTAAPPSTAYASGCRAPAATVSDSPSPTTHPATAVCAPAPPSPRRVASATSATRSPSEFPHASTVAPSTPASTPAATPMETSSATSSRASTYDQSTDIRNPPASHGRRAERLLGGDAASVVAAAAAARRAPASVAARRVVAVVVGAVVAARRSGERSAVATAVGFDHRCAAMSGMSGEWRRSTRRRANVLGAEVGLEEEETGSGGGDASSSSTTRSGAARSEFVGGVGAAVRGPDEEDVAGVEGEERRGGPDGDGAGEQHGEEVAERHEEEAHVAHEPAPLDDHRLATTATPGDDSDHAGDDGGHEQRATEHAAEANIPGILPSAAAAVAAACSRGERHDAGEHVGRAVPERQQRDAGDRRRQAEHGGEPLQRGAEVGRRRVAEEVEEHEQPQRERRVAQPWRPPEPAVQQPEVVHVPHRRARRVRPQIPAPRAIAVELLQLPAPTGRGIRRRRARRRDATEEDVSLIPRGDEHGQEEDDDDGESQERGGGGIARSSPVQRSQEGRHGR